MIASVTEQAVQASAAVVADWEQQLEELLERANRHVVRPEVRDQIGAYVASLYGEVERRNSWQLSEQAGAQRPYGFQHVLGRASWSAAGVRDEVRGYAVEHLSDEDAVWVLDETGFIKKGRHSAGVKRQYSGTAGRVENCQIGVFLAYSSCWGQTLVDRALYLPKEWASDSARRAQAGIPEEVVFQSKPQLGQRLLERAWAAGLAGRWVTGDAVYGNHRGLRTWLEEQRCSYVLAVSGPEYLRLTMSSFVRSGGQTELVPEQWQRLSAGAGSQGPRWYDWAYLALEDSATPDGWEHGVLLRRSLTDDEVTLYAVFAPLGTALSRLVEVAGQRWAVECGFQQAKALGLDQYEVRSWEGWHRHMTLVMLAQAALAAMRQQALKKSLWQWQLRQPLPQPPNLRPILPFPTTPPTPMTPPRSVLRRSPPTVSPSPSCPSV